MVDAECGRGQEGFDFIADPRRITEISVVERERDSRQRDDRHNDKLTTCRNKAGFEKPHH